MISPNPLHIFSVPSTFTFASFARHLQQFIVNSTLSITTKPQHLNSSAEALSLQGKTLRRFLLPLLAVFIMNLKHSVILRKHILYILSSVVNLTPNLREPHLAVRPQRLQRPLTYMKHLHNIIIINPILQRRSRNLTYIHHTINTHGILCQFFVLLHNTTLPLN